MPARGFTGTLRPIITYLGRKECPIKAIDRALLESLNRVVTQEDVTVEKDHFKIQWIEGDTVSKVVWEEEIVCIPGISFVPQIVGEGNFQPTGSMYVDQLGLRHRVMNCETGIFGSEFHKPETGQPHTVNQQE